MVYLHVLCRLLKSQLGLFSRSFSRSLVSFKNLSWDCLHRILPVPCRFKSLTCNILHSPFSWSLVVCSFTQDILLDSSIGSLLALEALLGAFSTALLSVPCCLQKSYLGHSTVFLSVSCRPEMFYILHNPPLAPPLPSGVLLTLGYLLIRFHVVFKSFTQNNTHSLSIYIVLFKGFICDSLSLGSSSSVESYLRHFPQPFY